MQSGKWFELSCVGLFSPIGCKQGGSWRWVGVVTLLLASPTFFWLQWFASDGWYCWRNALVFLSLELLIMTDLHSDVFQTHGWDARGSCGDVGLTDKAVCGEEILRCFIPGVERAQLSLSCLKCWRPECSFWYWYSLRSIQQLCFMFAVEGMSLVTTRGVNVEPYDFGLHHFQEQTFDKHEKSNRIIERGRSQLFHTNPETYDVVPWSCSRTSRLWISTARVETQEYKSGELGTRQTSPFNPQTLYYLNSYVQ